MKYSNIRVLVARSVAAVDAGQCDDVRECDTIKEAKDFARYALTEAYQQSGEFSEPMNYARVMADEMSRSGDVSHVCVADYVRKGYVAPVATDDDEPSRDSGYELRVFNAQSDLDDAIRSGNLDRMKRCEMALESARNSIRSE